MNTVGFVDDSFDLFQDYKKRMERQDIDLIAASRKMSKEEIYSWVLQNGIKCLLVDYKLKPNFDFAGTELVAYINSILPDLPCMILTIHPDDSIKENMVIMNNVVNRQLLDASDTSELANVLKQAVDVYNNRLALRLNEFESLYSKKSARTITADEEERLLSLFKLLKAYGEMDEIPETMLRTEVSDKIDSLLDKLDTYIDNIQKRKGE
jgi:hypothetical protein